MAVDREGKRRDFAIAFAGRIFILASCGCADDPDAKRLEAWRQAESEHRHLHVGGKLHFDFHSVRMYRMSWDHQESSERILSDGELNESRLPKDGLLLSFAQVKKLQAAVTGSHPEVEPFLCFDPHHGFVFFDKDGAIVGSIDICFQCMNYRGSPGGFPSNWDLLSIAELVHELGAPLSNPDWK